MLEKRSPSCPSGNSANSAIGLLSSIKENSSDAALQFVTTGEIGSGFLVIGTIVLFHIDDSIYEEGKINLDKLMPIGRLAGNSYSKQLNRFEIKRKIKPG